MFHAKFRSLYHTEELHLSLLVALTLKSPCADRQIRGEQMSGNEPKGMIVVAGPSLDSAEELGAIALEDNPNTVEPKPVATVGAEFLLLAIGTIKKALHFRQRIRASLYLSWMPCLRLSSDLRSGVTAIAPGSTESPRRTREPLLLWWRPATVCATS